MAGSGERHSRQCCSPLVWHISRTAG
ncbi:hypothetical protein E2C01_072902 [Portunus trituberculatus]|uniref:Uncharacterized protein n=1 Tax=Portunus trituberculatus TaxID=210409 RepID=A0A5B7I942_PORTR|nr:hypothetical protein [Portunus trituberculatus]